MNRVVTVYSSQLPLDSSVLNVPQDCSGTPASSGNYLPLQDAKAVRAHHWGRRFGARHKKRSETHALTCEKLVGVTRFELVTSSVSGKRSPPELNALSLGCRLRSKGNYRRTPSALQHLFWLFESSHRMNSGPGLTYVLGTRSHPSASVALHVISSYEWEVHFDL